MARRLYYEDVNMQQFTATVTAVREEEGRCHVALDQTAFYPEGGGQPGDTGILFPPEGPIRAGEQCIVTATYERDGEVWHVIYGNLAVGDEVRGQLNWALRQHWMQQHLGQHILSALVKACYGGNTVGVHFGREQSAVDYDCPLTDREVTELEESAAAVVARNLPVEILYPSPEEIAAKARRAPPETAEPIRIVKVGDLDYTPCCGVHPSTTGEVGIIKLLRHESYKGGTRLTFACGGAALKKFRAAWGTQLALQKLLSAADEDLAVRVSHLLDEHAALKHENHVLRAAAMQAEAAALLKTAHTAGAYRIVTSLARDSDEHGAARLKDLSDALTGQPGVVALLGCAYASGGGALLFRCHRDEALVSVKEPFAKAIEALSGKGGGNRVLCQGTSPGAKADGITASLDAAAADIAAQLQA